MVVKQLKFVTNDIPVRDQQIVAQDLHHHLFPEVEKINELDLITKRTILELVLALPLVGDHVRHVIVVHVHVQGLVVDLVILDHAPVHTRHGITNVTEIVHCQGKSLLHSNEKSTI